MTDTFTPPAQVQANAKRGLDLRQKHGRGGTEVGVARGRDLSNGASVSLDTIKRMNSYFARHEVDKKGEGWGQDSAGYIAWLLWGGDAGWSWAKNILRDQEKKDKATMNDFANGYAAIIKSEKQEDGTLKVYGKATDDSLDIDQQICDPTWLKRAMPDWFESGGNVREQHSNIAAGVATEYEAKADGHYITALVVDPVSVKKVETGVLKGFSIGIRSPRVVRDQKAAGGRIVDGNIVEVSLVDRPANPNAKLMLAKAAEGGTLMAIEQMIPNPAEVFGKNAAAPAEPSVESLNEAADLADGIEAVDPLEQVDADSIQEAVAPVVELVEAAKSAVSTLLKYDETTYNNAVAALSDLIIVEAQEMKAGSDERESIKELLHSIKHLFEWYEGEVAEGEVSTPNPEIAEDGIDDYAETLMSKSDGCECECEDCGMGKGCDLKMCKCNIGKSADVEEEVSESPEVQESTEVVESVEEPNADGEASTEAESLKAALEAAEAKAAKLEQDLAEALSKTVAGGPKRSQLNKSNKDRDGLLQMAAAYSQKAAATTDTMLAKGYRELAADFADQAEKAGK